MFGLQSGTALAVRVLILGPYYESCFQVVDVERVEAFAKQGYPTTKQSKNVWPKKNFEVPKFFFF